MKQAKLSVLLLSLVLIISACSTGNKAFKQGNYYDATLKAVKNLRSNPDSKKSRELITRSYPMALDYNKQKIDQLAASNSQDKYFTIVDLYKQLNTLADEIARCPAALEEVKPVVYFDKQLNGALKLAETEQVNVAKKLLQTGLNSDARMALKRLEWVQSNNAEYPEIDNLLLTAYNNAILKVVIEPQPELHASHAINSAVFYKRLMDYLKTNPVDEFTRFYSPQSAEELNISPNHILKLQFVDFKIGQLVNREKESSYESDSIAVGTYTAQDGNEYQVLGTVTADVTTYEREILAGGILHATIVDFASGETIQMKKFPSEYFWKNHWATYNGDQRALPDNILEMTKQKFRVPPSAQEMFLLVSEPIFSNSSAYIRSYYRKL